MTTESKELSFYGGDPGAVRYGNFINYYKFHSVKERLKNLNTKMFPAAAGNQPLLCLDIGCNTGELTRELYGHLQEVVYPSCDVRILAIDIDPALIQRAQETCHNPNISFIPSNIMDERDQNVIKEYLQSHQKDRFDVTFCFSVTMWIHLNNGDNGLENFLDYIKHMSRTIIVEPQPWHCYRNAQRRVKKTGSSFPLYETLKIRSNVHLVIENILSLRSHTKIYESPASSWNRTIQSYHDCSRVIVGTVN